MVDIYQVGLLKVAGCRRKLPPTWLVIGRLLCVAFLYGWCFLNKISLDWLIKKHLLKTIASVFVPLTVESGENSISERLNIKNFLWSMPPEVCSLGAAAYFDNSAVYCKTFCQP